MAFGMKHWFGLVGAGMALAVVWCLPPEARPSRPQSVKTHEEIRYNALLKDFRTTHSTLQRMRWADSLSTLVVRTAEGGAVVAAPAASGITGEQIDELHRGVVEELSGLEQRALRMVFGYVFQLREHGREWPSIRFDDRGRTETYVGTEDGVDHCYRVRVNDEGTLELAVADDLRSYRSTRLDHTTLGMCRPFLQYGLAGTHIQEWLESGALEFALGRDKRTNITEWRTFASAYRGRRGPFGLSMFGSRDDIALDRCAAGFADDCAGIFLRPGDHDFLTATESQEARLSPAISIRQRIWSFRGEGRFLLFDLEEEFGQDAFRDFWTSELQVADAFEAAFGVELEVWLVSWVGRVLRIDKPGPGLTRAATFGGILTMVLFTGIAHARTRKRHGSLTS